MQCSTYRALPPIVGGLQNLGRAWAAARYRNDPVRAARSRLLVDLVALGADLVIKMKAERAGCSI